MQFVVTGFKLVGMKLSQWMLMKSNPGLSQFFASFKRLHRPGAKQGSFVFSQFSLTIAAP